MSNVTLKTVVFLGSAKTLAPAWGGEPRLGDRVAKWVLAHLESREKQLGTKEVTVKHEVTVFDPIQVFGEGGALAESGGQLSSPHFFFKPGAAPAAMDAMRDTIKAADCFLIITPEYNHSIPPALSSMMGHFGGSNFALKPSGIITYSPGPWGGMRAAMALRPMLSELGCLPISKLVGIPSAADMLNEDGTLKDPSNRMAGQLPKMLTELEWLATAMCKQKAEFGLPQF